VVGVLLYAADQNVLRVLHREVCDALELLLLLVVQLVRVALEPLGLLELLGERLFARLEMVRLLVELLLALCNPALQAADLAPAVADFLVELAL